MIRTKIVSSLEKCFLDESIDRFEELKSISTLKNERLFVQLLYTDDSEPVAGIIPFSVTPTVSGFAPISFAPFLTSSIAFSIFSKL